MLEPAPLTRPTASVVVPFTGYGAIQTTLLEIYQQVTHASMLLRTKALDWEFVPTGERAEALKSLIQRASATPVQTRRDHPLSLFEVADLKWINAMAAFELAKAKLHIPMATHCSHRVAPDIALLPHGEYERDITSVIPGDVRHNSGKGSHEIARWLQRLTVWSEGEGLLSLLENFVLLM